MPEGLDIDRKQQLNGSMSPYTQHLIVSTGRSDWTSRIEDEKDTAAWGKFTADVKASFGRGGEFHHPYNNVLVSTSSFMPLEAYGHQSDLQRSGETPPTRVEAQETVDAFIFPAFRHFKGLNIEPQSSTLRKFIKSSLLPEEGRLHPFYKELSESERKAKTRDSSLATSLDSSCIDTPTILICSHGQRDSRCGILGPLLHAEFTRYINDRKMSDMGSGLTLRATTDAFTSKADSGINVNVGTISHIGGHKWAGNVIIYIPPTFERLPSGPHPLAGSGIWYGRVEPRHVEGIVEQTLLRGKVIQDHFRGGITEDGDILRL
ncbi:hypothetical protein LTR93_007419 [Exophiala xenobiotica]|nr:hypothetical protein LTR93_007419 [Exophiala xenobiotica]